MVSTIVAGRKGWWRLIANRLWYALRTIGAVLLFLSLQGLVVQAQSPSLEERVVALERQLQMPSAESPSDRKTLEQRIALLEARLATGVASPAPTTSGEVPRSIIHPPKIAGAPKDDQGVVTDVEMEGGSEEPSSELRDVVTGYAEFRYGKQPGVNGNAGFERFVLYFGHRFNPRVRFSSAVEVEPQAGEFGAEARSITLGQAYLEFLATPRISFRSGILLAPIGIINEKHEPTTFNGVNRPLVETYIIPSGWRDVGAGITGQFGSRWRYRAYIMGGLNAAEFTAGDGIRSGRQGGQAFSNLRNPAQVGRIEYTGHGFQLGASGYTAKSGFELKRVNPRVSVAEFDGQYTRRRFHLRGLFANVWISQAGELNRAIEEEAAHSSNVASRLGGWYVEPAVNMAPPEAHAEWLLFTRYERFNTQLTMPAGFRPRSEYQRDAIILGTTFRPIQDVALKLDYTFSGDHSHLGRMRDGLRLGLGWYF
jgi:hypothetical protein